MATQAITIDLPEAIVQQLTRLSEVTRQPIESLIVQCLATSLPPMLEMIAPSIQRELLNLVTLPIDELLTIANSQIDPKIHQQHVELIERNQSGTLTALEQKMLMGFQDLCDWLMLRKAYAWSVLHWRGHPIPEIKDLVVTE
jgi:hypothetical protein